MKRTTKVRQAKKPVDSEGSLLRRRRAKQAEERAQAKARKAAKPPTPSKYCNQRQDEHSGATRVCALPPGHKGAHDWERDKTTCDSVSTHDDEWICVRELGHEGRHMSEVSPGGTTAMWGVDDDGRERGEIFPISLRGKTLKQSGGWSTTPPAKFRPLTLDDEPADEVDDATLATLAREDEGEDDAEARWECDASFVGNDGRKYKCEARNEHHGPHYAYSKVERKTIHAAAPASAPSLADICGKCGRELGEHTGKKCPPKAKAKLPPDLARFADDVVTAIGRTLAPGATILGYPRHPAAALYPMIEDDELAKLAADIKANGLRDPIILISEGGKDSILDGSNRGRACELAGVKPRFEYYTDGRRGMPELVDFVLSKNEHRRHLAPSVRAMIADNAARLRQGGRKETGTGAGLTQAEAAKQHNVSERLVRQARVVNDKGAPKVREAVMKGKLELKAAEQLTKLPAAKQTEIAERALAKKSGEVRSGHVRALVKQEEKRAVVAKINTGRVAPLVGTFRLIVADPPWPYDNSDQHDGSRGHMGYPPMPIEAICGELAREVDRVAHDDCILGLWVPNAFIHMIGRVLEAWKFEHRTMITWGKDRLGMGSWARGKTEHLVIASRGKPIHTLNEVTTLMMAPVREHSRKPDEIMDALAKHCPGPHLEMFAREERPGWKAWGAETQKFEAA